MPINYASCWILFCVHFMEIQKNKVKINILMPR
jgi:hypothetical protein